MTIDSLIRALRGTSIDDVLVPGYLDRDESPVQFRPMMDALYLVCAPHLLAFTTIGDTGKMSVRIADEIRSPNELEPGMEAAAASLRQIVLRDPDAANTMMALHLWNAVEDPSGLRCDAARIDLDNGQQLFIDPSYHFGIRVGGAEQQEIWRANWIDVGRPPIEIVLTR